MNLEIFINYLTRFISYNWFLVPFLAALALAALFLDKNFGPRVFLAVVIAVVLHFLIDEFFLKKFLTKFSPGRRRPYLVHPENVRALGKKLTDSSFPSNHMAGTLSVLTVFLYYYKDWWPTIIGFAFLMGFARVRNGMHYWSDVLAGAILGIGWALLGIYLTNNFIIL